MAQRILLPQIKCSLPVCIFKLRCLYCTAEANRVLASRSRLKRIQRRIKLRYDHANLEREKEEIANALARIKRKNQELKNKIEAAKRCCCVTCEAAYAKIAVASYLKYKSTPR